MTSGTFRLRDAFERRTRSFYLGNYSKRNRKRSFAVLTRYDNIRFTPDRRDKAVELETQRLSFRSSERDVVDKIGDVHRTCKRFRWIQLFLETEEISGARCKIERHVSALLEDSDLIYIRPYENKLFLNEEQKQFIEKSKRNARRKRNRRRNVAVAIGLVLIFILSGFTLFALKQRDEALVQTKIAQQKKAKFIVDTSGEALKQAVAQGVYLIKPNLNEISSLAGKNELQHEELISVAREIIATGKCEVIVVSMGQAGAMLITTEITEVIPSPPVVRRSTVGAGDSMVAGIVYSLAQGKSIEEAVHYGVACGTSATMNPGTELCKKETADKLFNSMKIEIN